MSTQPQTPLKRGPTPLPDSLTKQLGSFRSRIRFLKLAEVLVSAIAGFILAYLLVFIVERFSSINALLRTILLIVGTLGFTIALPFALRKWVWNTRHWEKVAQLLRKPFPTLGDEILSVIEMVNDQTGSGASPRLIEAATEQTRQRVAKQDLSAAAGSTKAQNLSLLAAFTFFVAAMLLFFYPSAAKNAWARFLTPWTDTPRFTFTRIGDLPNEKVVPYGESFPLNVSLDTASQWSPETATAKVGPSVVSANNSDGRYPFSLPAQTEPTQVSVSIGDDHRSVELLPMTRPELVDITTKTTPPDYLQQTQPLERTTTNRRVSVVAGSKIEFDFQASRDLESASVDGQPVDVHGQRVVTAPMLIETPKKFAVDWSDVHQLRPLKPIELSINVIEDQFPVVVLGTFKERVLLESKSLRFEFNGRDDFGLRKVGLEWSSLGEEDQEADVKGEKILFAGGPQVTSVDERGIFTPKLENLTPQILTLRLFAEDFHPDHGRIYSRPQTLQVMSHDQHVEWVNQNMQRWKSKADAIYERELGLLEENRNLRDLDIEQLSLPENVRRLENQVAAERENAQRLAAAVVDGRELIEQAMTNENMRADQVNRWAESLANLERISGEDMANLAGRLAEVQSNAQSAAGAPNSAANGANGNSNSSDSEAGDAQGADAPASLPPTGPPGDVPEPSDSVGKNRLQPSQQNSEPSDESSGSGDEQEASPSAPSILDIEESMLDRESDSESESESSPATGGGALALPSTQLLNPIQEQEEQEEQAESDTPAESEEKGQPRPPSAPAMDGIVEDHKKLLEEFRKARAEMDQIMGAFENATFVKRFKAAARNQLKNSGEINKTIPASFGSNESELEPIKGRLEEAVEIQRTLFQKIRELRMDLKAFQGREADEARQKILDEMEESNMEVKLEELPKRLEKNRLGDALHRTEFWADTFDRWAEELVPPQSPGEGAGAGGGEEPSLPPQIVLDVMRQIEDETILRDETRGFQMSREAMSSEEQRERNDALTIYQMAIQERSLDTIKDITDLPNAEADFADPLSQVRNGVEAMNDASGILFDGNTGDPALAAESAAIEALLLTNRGNEPPPPSSPQENDTGVDGSEQFANPMAMLNPSGLNPLQEDLGDSDEASGSVSDNVPEKFRDGIDSFTNKLGRWRKNRGDKE